MKKGIALFSEDIFPIKTTAVQISTKQIFSQFLSTLEMHCSTLVNTT